MIVVTTVVVGTVIKPDNFKTSLTKKVYMARVPASIEMYKKLHMTAEQIGAEPNKVMIAPEYMLWLLYRHGKPLNENLLLKKMNEAKIDRRGHTISDMLGEMQYYGIASFARGKGWKLTDKALKLIESFKPGSDIDYNLATKIDVEVVADSPVGEDGVAKEQQAAAV